MLTYHLNNLKLKIEDETDLKQVMQTLYEQEKKPSVCYTWGNVDVDLFFLYKNLSCFERIANTEFLSQLRVQNIYMSKYWS